MLSTPAGAHLRSMILALPFVVSSWVSLAAQSSLAQEAGAGVGGWVALPTPILCEARGGEALPTPLSSGSHLARAGDGPTTRAPAPAPRFPIATFQKILEDPVPGTRGGKIEFFKSSASILARGDPAALEAARQRIAEFDRAADALAIDLEVDLAGSGRAAGADAASGGAEHWTQKRRVLSGDETFFGERHTAGFLMTFDVEVAADSGIAAPVLGSASYGHTLHVRASRVDGGRRVHVEGLLDLSELTSLERFDPETPDLGVIQEPALDFVQVAFAGVVDSGGVLEVSVLGAPIARPDWKLSIKAVTRADEAPTKDPAAKTAFLDVVDLAYLSGDPLPLSAFVPGGELDRQSSFLPPPRGPVAIPPASIAAALDARSSESSAGRVSTWWGEDLLVLRRSDTAARAEARSLVAAGESARLATCRIEARQGGLSASFPACAGSPARLLAGRERTALVGYKVEIAPQTWMAAPEVQKLFDGLALSAQVHPGAAECSLWIAKSAPAQVVVRGDAQVGKLQVLSRSLRTDRARILSGEGERELAARAPQGAPADAVVLRCLAP
jgi:hypothetical protein